MRDMTVMDVLRTSDIRVAIHVAVMAMTDQPRPTPQQLAKILNDEFSSIKGNRGDNVAMTWDDVRLMLAATLRAALTKLEEYQ